MERIRETIEDIREIISDTPNGVQETLRNILSRISELNENTPEKITKGLIKNLKDQLGHTSKVTECIEKFMAEISNIAILENQQTTFCSGTAKNSQETLQDKYEVTENEAQKVILEGLNDINQCPSKEDPDECIEESWYNIQEMYSNIKKNIIDFSAEAIIILTKLNKCVEVAQGDSDQQILQLYPQIYDCVKA